MADRQARAKSERNAEYAARFPRRSRKRRRALRRERTGRQERAWLAEMGLLGNHPGTEPMTPTETEPTAELAASPGRPA